MIAEPPHCPAERGPLPTPECPQVPNDLEDSVLRSLRRITRAIDLHSRKLASRYRLTAPQLVCLRQIARAGELTPSALSREVHLSQATVTGILDRLEARGIVVRERSVVDKRRVNVRLSAGGEELVRDAPSPLHERFAKRLSTLSEVERVQISEVLHKIVEMMEAEHLDASPVLHTGPLTDPAEINRIG